MAKGPIVDEAGRVREDQGARYGFDVKAILMAARKRQRRTGHKVASFVAKEELSARSGDTGALRSAGDCRRLPATKSCAKLIPWTATVS
jgi:hypothetical protein